MSIANRSPSPPVPSSSTVTPGRGAAAACSFRKREVVGSIPTAQTTKPLDIDDG